MTNLSLGDHVVIECKGHRQKARSVAWNNTGTRLASASTDRTAKIWDFEGSSSQGREIYTLTGHEDHVERVRWHPCDPHILCTAAADRKIRLWDVRSAKGPMIFGNVDLVSSPKHDLCQSVEWRPDGTALAVAEKDNAVHVYDIRNLERIRTCNLKPDIVQECHFSPGGTRLVAATRRTDGMGTIRVWGDGPDAAVALVGHTGPIYCLRFSPCGMRLATGGQDALVGLWSARDMVCTSTISRMTKFVRSVSFSHDSLLLASSSEESVIDIAEASSGDKVGEIAARHGADELAWNPMYYALAFASGDAPPNYHHHHHRGGDKGVPSVTVVKVSLKRTQQ